MTRYASGQSDSTATAVNPLSAISRLVMNASLPVELVCPVRRLSQKHNGGITNAVEQSVVLGRIARERAQAPPEARENDSRN